MVERAQTPKLLRRSIKIIVALGVLVIVLIAPGLPWSIKVHHWIGRIRYRLDAKVSAFCGDPPRLISIRGRVVRHRLNKEAVSGGEVQIQDSVSGWASLTDDDGAFLVKYVRWFRGARYKLVITANDYQTAELDMAPSGAPRSGVLDIGEIDFDNGCRINPRNFPGLNDSSFLGYDRESAPYFRSLFLALTDGKSSDEARLDAINTFTASRRFLGRPGPPPSTVREILTKGSQHCDGLALAFATLAKTGGYRTRLIDLMEDEQNPMFHLVAEVYYDDRWHLYDPTYGATFKDDSGKVASYRELRLNPRMLGDARFPECTSGSLTPDGPLCAPLYETGICHYYYFNGDPEGF